MLTQTSGNGFSIFGSKKLPHLPEYDGAAYPYAYICEYCGGVYLRAGQNTPIFDGAKAVTFQNGNSIEYVLNGSAWAENSGGAVTEYGVDRFIWCNHPVMIRVDEQEWETLWEGEMTFEPTVAGTPPKYVEHIWNDHEPPAQMFYPGEIIRFTVDGASKVYTAKKDKYDNAYFGNRYLSFDEIEGEGDTGDDFSVTLTVRTYGFEYRCFARNPGTYRVKLERKVPAAYLYNGYQLPPLPKWDKTAYPYACITFTIMGMLLVLSPVPMIVSKNGGLTVPSIAGTVVWLTASGHLNTTIPWSEFEERNQYYGFLELMKPNWTNTNIYNEDGTLSLEASEPVPIYE